MREAERAPKRRGRSGAKRALRLAFEALQRVGVDVLPHHFYSEIPDIRRLRGSRRWRAPRTMVGVGGGDVGAQLEFARICCTPIIRSRLEREPLYDWACAQNGALGYGPTESDFLYAFARSRRPRRVVQVGAGVSTAIILRAAADAGYEVDVTAVDPYPTDFLRQLAARNEIRLVDQEAQDVGLETLTALDQGDLLFVDSTHTVKPDSEVNLLILEVLPRLTPGVFVHFHDIYFPYDYPRGLLSSGLFFQNESNLLHAFLIGNASYEIRVSLSMLHYVCPDELRLLLPNYRPAPNDDGLEVAGNGRDQHFPNSVFLEALG